jgi:hypothetical protein
MSMRPARIPLPAAALLASMACSLPAHAAGDPPAGTPARGRTDALKRFDEAEAAMASGDKEAAYKAYRAAWEALNSYDTAANLGTVELKLGKHRAAAEHLRWARDHFPPSGDPALLARIEKQLAKTIPHVGQLAVTANVPGAEIFVDGKSAGVAPLPDEIFVEPGTRTIEARRLGYETATQTADVRAGSTDRMTLVLRPSPAPPPPPPPPPPHRSVVPGAVLGGVAGAALVTGIALAAAYGGKKADADSLDATIRSAGGYCTAPSGSVANQCSQLHAATQDAATFGRAAVGLLVGGAALVAASGAYFLWPNSTPKPPSGMMAVPVAMPRGGGVLVQGSF